MKPLRLCASVALILCTGCGTPKVWYRPGSSQEQMELDKAECRLRWDQMFYAQPNVNVNVAVGDNAGRYVAAETASQGIGQAIAKGNFVDDCLRAKGYRRIPVSEVPAK